MGEWLTLDETLRLIEFIVVVELRADHAEYLLIEEDIKKAKNKLKNSHLSKLIENYPLIPANCKLKFFLDLYGIANMYRVREQSKDIRNIFSKSKSDYLKQLKKEVKAIEVAKNKQTDNKTINSLNAIIETKSYLISSLSKEIPSNHRPTNDLTHGLLRSFKSVWESHTNSKKMDATAYDIAAQFFSELGYSDIQTYQGQEIRDKYDHKRLREMFTNVEKTDKVSPFYQRIK